MGVLLLVLGSVFLYIKLSTKEETVPTTKNDTSETLNNEKEYIFEELGISLTVPQELHVIKSPNFNAETGKLESYNFYIQNYGYEGGPSTGDFQIYGLYQPDLPEIILDDIAEMKIDTENYMNVKEFSAGPLQGYEAQQKGERPNYIYSLLLNGRILRIAVSQGTAENKIAAEKILKTLKVLQTVQVGEGAEVPEMGGVFNFTYPNGWKLSKEINGVVVTSPDYQISEGFPVLEEGAELAVYTKKTTVATINEDLSNNPITSKIPNKVDTIVAEQNAIRYEYGYEGVNAVMTEFIKDGTKYSLRYRFVGENSKSAYMGAYEEMLRTFEFL
ncbi:MAG: hypothetical protein UU55_C0005G0014 [candidate division WWE3 bacterium GW2011_GWC2_41_23]|nr:MAG: hypothetical protein UU55_C0005G0014 [candidate division WWE3 bacterium GW2011_GWC2_41_23]